MSLDLETLKQVKFVFESQSDQSTKCNGYQALCRMIEDVESSVINQPVNSDSSTYRLFKLANEFALAGKWDIAARLHCIYSDLE